jgi:hypothetical protein
MKTFVGAVIVLIAVIIVFVTFVFNLVSYDCSFVQWDESDVPGRCKHVDSSNVAFVETWNRALIGTVLLLVAFAMVPCKRYRKVTMAVVLVGGAHLMIASGFCFKAYYLSINYPGGACCYNTSLDSCREAPSADRCPMDWIGNNGKVLFASGESCLMSTCASLYNNKNPHTPKKCKNNDNCTQTEVCSTMTGFKGCICKLNYGRTSSNSRCSAIQGGTYIYLLKIP